MLKRVNITHEQNLFDVAIQMYGHIEGVVWILEDNPDVHFGDEVNSLLIRSDFIRQDIVDYLTGKGISISTVTADSFTQEQHNEFTNEFNFEFN